MEEKEKEKEQRRREERRRRAKREASKKKEGKAVSKSVSWKGEDSESASSGQEEEDEEATPKMSRKPNKPPKVLEQWSVLVTSALAGTGPEPMKLTFGQLPPLFPHKTDSL